jgi:lysophospholipase L1-like esterase
VDSSLLGQTRLLRKTLASALLLTAAACGSDPEQDPSMEPSVMADSGAVLPEAAAPAPLDASAPNDSAVAPNVQSDAGVGFDAATDAAAIREAAVSSDAAFGSDASSPDGRVVDAGPASDTSLCTLKGSQVAVLGDSYVALDVSFIGLDNFPFVMNLESLAKAAGALKSGQQYRRMAQSGASMNGEPNIPAQLDRTLQMDKDLKLIIMTGGGNDILVNNRECLEFANEVELIKSAKCVKVVQDAIDAGQKMFDKGVAAGVKAVIYFFYPHLPGLANGGIGAGAYPNVMLDYAYPKVKELCDRQVGAPCYFVDMRAAFDKDNNGLPDPGLINLDGIHPTGTSSPILAKEVWRVMQERCLASKP